MNRPREHALADDEREMRAIGTLVRNYEQVSGLQGESGNDGSEGGGRREREAEAEAARRALAEQIARLVKAQPGDGG